MEGHQQTTYNGFDGVPDFITIQETCIHFPIMYKQRIYVILKVSISQRVSLKDVTIYMNINIHIVCMKYAKLFKYSNMSRTY